MVVFKDWIFSLFPRYIWEHDTLPVNGKGLFQRYMETFGEEIDGELKNHVTDFIDILDVTTTEDKYLVYLVEFLGSPPSLFDQGVYSDARYRKLLRYLMDIVKCKGTKRSYELIFGLLGCTIILTETAPPVMKYDWYGELGEEGNTTLVHYDSGLYYDEDCPSCSSYTLAITDPDGVLAGALTTERLYNLLIKIIKFVEPINVNLTSLTINGGEVTDGDVWVLTTGTWDDSKYWNDTKIYRDTP